MKHVVINATNFKATCLALLDEIDRNGGTVTITKRGRAVATLGQVQKPKWKSSKGIWAGKVEIGMDIVNFQMDWVSPEEILNPPARRPADTRQITKKPKRIPA
jgi:antitoxin (DNA-binding transcriptional repressor) of toxin-antitoxin stability system